MDYDVTIDGRSIAVRSIDQDGVVYVELYPFCAETGAEVKPIPGEDQLSVCRGDLCIPLAAGDLLEMAAAAFVRLDHIASPLDFAWRTDGARVIVETEAGAVGLGVGDRPPGFELPDLFTGEKVRLTDYVGRRTVFYMWASR